MTPKLPLKIRIERPQVSFGDTMNDIRAWLDNRKIEPTEFKSDIGGLGAIAIDIRFESENDARRFEEEFGLESAAG